LKRSRGPRQTHTPRRTLYRVVGGLLLIVAAATLVTSFTAANTVPPSRAGVSVENLAPGEFPPTSVLTFPTAGAYRTASWNLGCTSAICGTAHDSAGGSSISAVNISILGPGGHYWNGSNFNTATTQQKFLAVGTSSWSLGFPAANFATAGGGDGTYVIKSFATDGSGNIEAPAATVTFSLDNTAPSNSLTLIAQSPAGASFKSGNIVYYRGTGGGSGGNFKVRNTVADIGSGPASSTAAALGGTTVGWTSTPGTVGTPTGGPYDSNTFSWTEGASSQPTATFSGSDIAGNTAATVLTFTNDSTSPTGGAVTVNGIAASGLGTTSVASDAAFAIGSRADYVDTGSGLASSVLTVQSFALSSSNGIAAGVCGAASAPFNSPTVVTGTTQPAGMVTGRCYTYALTGTDNVGNTAVVLTTVLLDSTAPSAPTPSLSAATGNTYISGTTAYIDPLAGKSGGFTLTGVSADPDSGLAKINFPALTGFTSGGGDDTASPYATTYNWAGAAAATGAKTLTATNTTNLTATSTFTVTADTTPPTSGALTVNGLAASAGGTTSVSSNTTIAIGTRTDYADTGSGLASSVLTVQSFVLSSSNGIAAGICGAASAPFSSPTVVTGTSQPSGIVTGRCYTYALTGTDNVGNTAVVSTTVMLDTTAPSAPTATLFAGTGNTYINGTTVYINSQAGESGGFTLASVSSDSDSGLSKINFPTLTGFTSGGGDDTSSPYTTTYSWAGAGAAAGIKTLTATNTTNLTATSTFTVAADTTSPTGGTLTVNGLAASAAGTTSSASSTTIAIGTRTAYTDAGSGLLSSTLTVQSETLTGGTCGAPGSSGSYATPTAITGTTTPTITAGFCYLFTLTGLDLVGNAAAVMTTVQVAPASSLNKIAIGHGCPSGGCGWVVGSGGAILYTANGTSFDGETTGTNVNLNDATSPTDNSHVWAVGDGGTILECTTSCQTPGSAVWTRQTSNTTANLYAVAAADNSSIWAVGAGGVIDFWNGTSWTVQQSGKAYDLLDINGSVTGTGWAVGTGGTILESTNGTTWTAQGAPSIAGSTTYSLESVAATTASAAWAVGAGGAIISTTNTGATWTKATSPTSNFLYGVVASGSSVSAATPVYAVGGGGVILVSTNGTTFTSQTSPTTRDLLGLASESGSTLLAVGVNDTILHTTTTGASWSSATAPLIGLSPSTGAAGTTVTVTGSGLTANSALTATFNNSPVTLGGTRTTTSAGAVTGATFTVPGSLTANSIYGVLLTDASGKTAATTFTAK
jgi:hypothetical protein